jgi:hypothetical protein
MRWRTNPEVMAQRLGESMVLVNLASDRILELNETAAQLYEMADHGLDQEEMEARLAEEYAVEPQALRAEIDALLLLLTEEQVVSADDG